MNEKGIQYHKVFALSTGFTCPGAASKPTTRSRKLLLTAPLKWAPYPVHMYGVHFPPGYKTPQPHGIY